MLEKLYDDFIHCDIRILCKDRFEVANATKLIADLGVRHGSSGYSKRLIDPGSDAHDEGWNCLTYDAGGIEYYRERVPQNAITLDEVYEQYCITPPQDTIDDTFENDELDAFLAL